MITTVFGLPGTGKSYLAKRLAETLDATYLSTDQVRKQFRHQGKYSEKDKAFVYQKMLELVRENLEKSRPVVVDGTFSKAESRQKLQAVAGSDTIYWIRTTADESLIQQRVSRKRTDSEADFEVYQKIKAAYEEPDFSYLLLDSGKSSLEDMLTEVRNYITSTSHGS